jgi:hypothetical protein
MTGCLHMPQTTLSLEAWNERSSRATGHSCGREVVEMKALTEATIAVTPPPSTPAWGRWIAPVPRQAPSCTRCRRQATSNVHQQLLPSSSLRPPSAPPIPVHTGLIQPRWMRPVAARVYEFPARGRRSPLHHHLFLVSSCRGGRGWAIVTAGLPAPPPLPLFSSAPVPQAPLSFFFLR